MIRLPLKSRIISILRRLWLMSPERQNILKEYRISYGRYRCCECKKVFKRKEVEIHHLKTVSKMEDTEWSWDQYIKNLFEGECVILCRACHKDKTKFERLKF